MDCKNIPHKTDCMVNVLDKSVYNPDIFFSRVNTIIRLHSNVMEEKPELVQILNNELRIVGLSYDVNTAQLILLESFEPYIMGKSFLDIEKTFLPNSFYLNLVNEINWCYNTRAFTATIVLIRKLLENLILDILRKKYQNDSSKEKLFWNEKRKRFPRFVELINNFEKQKKDFYKLTGALDEKFFKFLHTIREIGNKGTHTMEEIVRKSQLDEKREMIELRALILLDLLRKIV